MTAVTGLEHQRGFKAQQATVHIKPVPEKPQTHKSTGQTLMVKESVPGCPSSYSKSQSSCTNAWNRENAYSNPAEQTAVSDRWALVQSKLALSCLQRLALHAVPGSPQDPPASQKSHWRYPRYAWLTHQTCCLNYLVNRPKQKLA